ncbi:Rpn family recombination-promoting nuclease/putative transposase [Bacillus cereus]|nr:Rpn family recombination-promoting nuclease/putative transposase [Bacillus cereus]
MEQFVGAKRLKPLNDFIFKKIFGENTDKDLLIGFLNSIVSFRIEDIEVREEKLTKESLVEKQGILDIKAITSKKEKINVEVQLLNQYNMVHRTLFYWSKLYTENFKSGQNFKELSQTITINLLGFEMLELESYRSTFHLYEDTEKCMLTDLLEIHFIELPKFDKIENKDYSNPLHRWLLFLKEDVPTEELEVLRGMDGLINKADNKLNYLSADDEVKREYELREKHLSDEKTRIEGARAESKEEGIKEGKEAKAIEMAKKMLKKNKSVEEIAEFTELDMDVLEKLKQNLN